MPITYYSVDNIREALLNLRKDLHEIHYEDNYGKRRLASQVEAQETILLSVADMFNINLDEQPEDEIAQLKQRIEKLERERMYTPVPYPVYPVTYPYIPTFPPPAVYEYKVTCSTSGVRTHLEGTNENC